MTSIKGQAFLLKFDEEARNAEPAGAVVLDDGTLIVGGVNGGIPYDIGMSIVHMAEKAGIAVTVIICQPPIKVVALTWGEIDIVGQYDLIVTGVAASSTAAFMNVLLQSHDELFDMDDLLGPERK